MIEYDLISVESLQLNLMNFIGFLNEGVGVVSYTCTHFVIFIYGLLIKYIFVKLAVLVGKESKVQQPTFT